MLFTVCIYCNEELALKYNDSLNHEVHQFNDNKCFSNIIKLSGGREQAMLNCSKCIDVPAQRLLVAHHFLKCQNDSTPFFVCPAFRHSLE